MALCVIFSCDFLKICVDIFELQAYNNIKDKGNNKFPISQINQLVFKATGQKGVNYDKKRNEQGNRGSSKQEQSNG